MNMFSFLALTLIVVALPAFIEGHGILMDPPGRASLWRFGFNTPINFEDNELFCGGFVRQFELNGGKCGICGDAYDLPEPRENEAGGKFGLGIISKTYKAGETIEVKVDLTANHLGYFQFRLCPNNNVNKDPSQECFDQHVLHLADGSGTKYEIVEHLGYNALVNVHLKLPHGLTCSQCILQWHYNTGNSWGVCESGEGAMGCGDQETFRGCADIAITA